MDETKGDGMSYWPVRPVNTDHRLGVGQLAQMLSRVGQIRPNLLAAELLQFVCEKVPLAQCTIFAYDRGSSARIISFADRARTVELPEISLNYAERFHSLDGNRQVMAANEASRPSEKILLQRQCGEDIAHPEYRRLCYERPQISERVALLSLFDGWRWLSVNFYRGREHGKFSAREIEFLEAVAPLLMQMVRLHYGAYVAANELPEMLTERLAKLHPDLTRRDRQLLKAILTGASADEISEQMGIQPSSTQTYVKRIYRKLGISGQRELTGLVLQPLR
jgi:DNA-binding CsgD family transcriptional regulator